MNLYRTLSKLLFASVALLSAGQLQKLYGQTQTVDVNYNTFIVTEEAMGPISGGNGLISRYSYSYKPAELAAVGIANNAVITSIGWVKFNTAQATGGAPLRIYMRNANYQQGSSTTWTEITDTSTLVYENLNYVVPATAAPNYISFQLTTPFVYTGQYLRVAVEYDGTVVPAVVSTAPYQWYGGYTNGAFDNIGTRQPNKPAAEIISSNGQGSLYINYKRPHTRLSFIAAPPCPAVLTAGNTITIPQRVQCSGSSVRLELSGKSVGTGQTYEWQRAANLAGPYTTLVPATTDTFYTYTPATGIHYYRAILSCNGTKDTSVPVRIYITPQLSGTYTINAAQPTDANNFQTFGDVAKALACNPAGAVTLNVIPNSGPYIEDLEIKQISTSLSKPLIFYGNGNIFQGNISLKKVDYATIDSLNITGHVSILGSSQNTIRKCNITPINTSNGCVTVGVYSINNTLYSSYSITITNNTFSNSKYGVSLSSTLGPSYPLSLYGLIANNKFINQSQEGIYLISYSDININNNEFSRPSPATNTTYRAITLSTKFNNITIDKNKIHTILGTNLADDTLDFIGVYIPGSSQNTSTNVIVSNNVIYADRGKGNHCGIKLKETGVKLYHNTIVMSGNADNNPSNETKCVYVEGSTPSGLEMKNNLFYIDQAGNSKKYAVDIDAPFTPFTANNNDYFITPNTTGTVAVGQLGTADYTTLSAWQSTTGQDLNSVTLDPMFISPATINFSPSASALDNLGTPITGVTTDILNNPRSSTTPDMGAYEFLTNNNCAAPTGVTVANVTYSGATISWQAVTGATGYEYALTTNAAPPAAGTPINAITYPASGLNTATTYYFHLRADCGSGNYSAWGSVSFTTKSCVIPVISSPTGITGTSASFAWTNINSVSGYEYVLTTSSIQPTTAGTFTTTNTYYATSLNPNTNYCLHVRAKCTATTYSGWATICFTTSNTVACNPPAGPLVNNITANTAEVIWGGVAGASGYEYDISMSSTPPMFGTSTTNTTYNATGLTGNSLYYAHVRTDCGTQGFSAWVSSPFVTADTCLAPTAFVSNINPTSADIAWTSMGGAIAYEFVVNTSAIAPTISGTTTTATTYSATGLSPNTFNYVHLRTVCTNDTSVWSTTLFITPTSVNQIGNSGAKWSVFPNPATDKLNVQVTGLSRVNAEIKLTDVTGKTVKSFALESSTATIDISDMSQGVYIVHYLDEYGSSTIKMIKK